MREFWGDMVAFCDLSGGYTDVKLSLCKVNELYIYFHYTCFSISAFYTNKIQKRMRALYVLIRG